MAIWIRLHNNIKMLVYLHSRWSREEEEDIIDEMTKLVLIFFPTRVYECTCFGKITTGAPLVMTKIGTDFLDTF